MGCLDVAIKVRLDLKSSVCVLQVVYVVDKVYRCLNLIGYKTSWLKFLCLVMSGLSDDSPSGHSFGLMTTYFLSAIKILFRYLNITFEIWPNNQVFHKIHASILSIQSKFYFVIRTNPIFLSVILKFLNITMKFRQLSWTQAEVVTIWNPVGFLLANRYCRSYNKLNQSPASPSDHSTAIFSS